MNNLREIGDAPEHREAFFRVLMEAAFDGILISRDGVIIEASQTLLTASGYAADELIGRPVLDFVAEEFHDGVQQHQADTVDGRFDAVAVTKDGRRLMIEIVTRSFEIRGRHSRISALRDVTEKRAMQAQLHLAQKVEVLGRLASGIAHDFNNVLAIVRSYAGLLLDQLEGGQRGDMLEILKAADAGAALTRQLMAFSRNQAPRRTPVNLSDVVDDSFDMLRRLIGRQYELVTDLGRDLHAVSADSSQMQQVVLNLVVNARDAMPEGGKVMVTTRNADVTDAPSWSAAPARPGRYVMLSVGDSGIGMSEDVKALIFQPFFTTKQGGQGTGLGLAIVRTIVEQSKGFIVVDSTLGLGTTFAVYLPAA